MRQPARDVVRRFGDWLVFFSWGSHDGRTNQTLPASWLLRTPSGDEYLIDPFDIDEDGFRSRLARYVDPEVLAAMLLEFSPRVVQTSVGPMLAPGLSDGGGARGEATSTPNAGAPRRESA